MLACICRDAPDRLYSPAMTRPDMVEGQGSHSVRSRLARILYVSLPCRALANALLATLLLGEAAAQDDAARHPTKPIRIIVGFAAGGGNDLVARIVGPKLSHILGQPV